MTSIPCVMFSPSSKGRVLMRYGFKSQHYVWKGMSLYRALRINLGVLFEESLSKMIIWSTHVTMRQFEE